MIFASCLARKLSACSKALSTVWKAGIQSGTASKGRPTVRCGPRRYSMNLERDVWVTYTQGKINRLRLVGSRDGRAGSVVARRDAVFLRRRTGAGRRLTNALAGGCKGRTGRPRRLGAEPPAAARRGRSCNAGQHRVGADGRRLGGSAAVPHGLIRPALRDVFKRAYQPGIRKRGQE